MLTMGSDFNYQNANTWCVSMIVSMFSFSQ